MEELEFLKELVVKELFELRKEIIKRIAVLESEKAVAPYTQARQIYYGFEVNDSGIFAVEVRNALMVLQSRNGKAKEYKTRKDAGGVRITRIR